MATTSVTTNQADYAPGQTAIFTSNSSVGGAVQYRVAHTTGVGADGIWGTADDELGPSLSGSLPWYVVDGGAGDLDGVANGAITTSWFVNSDALNQSFLLTAQQVEAGGDGAFGTADDVAVGTAATTSFTDDDGQSDQPRYGHQRRHFLDQCPIVGAGTV